MKIHQVAGLYFSMGDDLEYVYEQSNYTPFYTDKSIDDKKHLFHIETGDYIDKSKENPSSQESYSNENGSYTVFKQDSYYYWNLKRAGDEHCYGMLLDLNNKKAILNFEIKDDYAMYAANDFIRFAFIYTSAFHHTILLHASCISLDENAIAFTGHSGVGKSTHSSLWQKFVKGAELINDDQPAVSVVDNKIIVYGTPWSGKTSCYKQKKAHLRAILCMKQAKENKLTKLNTTTLFTHMLPECALIKTDKATMPSIIKTLATIAENLRGAQLENKPEREAVQMAYDFLLEKNKRGEFEKSIFN